MATAVQITLIVCVTLVVICFINRNKQKGKDEKHG